MVEPITLVIADNEFKFNKVVLVNHSPYFRNLFEGDWEGKDENKVILREAKMAGVANLLSKLLDPNHVIKIEFVLDVLIVALKYQFPEMIKSMQTKVLSVLSVVNCLDIWFGLKPYYDNDKITTEIYLKAKAMALDEFMTVKDDDAINKLSLENLRLYLGQTGLRTESEIHVFKTAIKWFHASNPQASSLVDSDILLKLLKCLAFGSLTVEDIQNNILSIPEVMDNMEIVTILKCYMDIKNNDPRAAFFKTKVKVQALSLKRAKARFRPKGPCILVEEINKVPTSKVKVGDSSLLYFDLVTGKFEKLLAIDDQLIGQLDGYGLTACKESIYLFGGMENGQHPKSTCWEYNSFRKDWKRKASVPADMNYFETCVVKDTIFTAAGAHMHSWIRQYNPNTDKWTDKLGYAAKPQQIRTCCFSDQCLIFDVADKSVYILNDTCTETLPINFTHITPLPPTAEELGCFYYNGSFYVKGPKLLKINRLQNDEFKEVITAVLPVVNEEHPLMWDRMELVICNNFVYTLYQYTKPQIMRRRRSLRDEEIQEDLAGTVRFPKNYMYTFEKFNMDTQEKDYLFQNISDEKGFEIDGVKYTVAPALKLFAFDYYSFGHEDKLVFPLED